MIIGDTKNEVFDALADEYRRQLLVELLENDWYTAPKQTASSEEIANAHNSLLFDYLHSSRDIDDVDKQLLYIHHIHLPKLEEYGFIDWQHNTQTVTRGHRFDQLRPYLEALEETQSERGTPEAVELSSR